MSLQIELDGCIKCYHCDTNIPRCLHPKAVEERPSKEARYIRSEHKYGKGGFMHITTGHRGIKVKKIPNWCPLKKGEKY